MQSRFVQDNQAVYYIYGQTMSGTTQYGIVGCSSVDDYLTGTIKKHELTRTEKEEDRMRHIQTTNANAEPVFFAFKDHTEIQKIIDHTVAQDPEYDFTTEDQVGHHFWIIDDENTIARISEIFDTEIPDIYVADGHHRTAAAALVGKERKENNPNHTGNEEYNFFMSVSFPESHLRIIDYNRLVKDLNGLSAEGFIIKLSNHFTVTEMGEEEYKPENVRYFSMYINGKWFKLVAKQGTWDDKDPVKALDVTTLTDQVLASLLNIQDLRLSNRIDYVGGIRGLGELKKRVDSGEMKVVFALYPASMAQIMNIADNDKIMPPKTTWFEPKLRYGLVFHKLD